MTTIVQPTGDEVRALRGDMSVQDFATLVHASAAAVYAWESERRPMPLATWELLLIYFGRIEPRTQKKARRPSKAKDRHAVEDNLQAALASLQALRRALANA